MELVQKICLNGRTISEKTDNNKAIIQSRVKITNKARQRATEIKERIEDNLSDKIGNVFEKKFANELAKAKKEMFYNKRKNKGGI